MQLDVNVKIQADKLSQTEYLIKDMNDIIIGRFSSMELESSSKTCDIKLKFYREYNCELLNDTLTKYAFDQCELHRVEASALVNNEKSRKVLTKCGFKLIGINEKYLLINGKWEDHATYYILKEYFD